MIRKSEATNLFDAEHHYCRAHSLRRLVTTRTRSIRSGAAVVLWFATRIQLSHGASFDSQLAQIDHISVAGPLR